MRPKENRQMYQTDSRRTVPYVQRGEPVRHTAPDVVENSLGLTSAVPNMRRQCSAVIPKFGFGGDTCALRYPFELIAYLPDQASYYLEYLVPFHGEKRRK